MCLPPDLRRVNNDAAANAAAAAIASNHALFNSLHQHQQFQQLQAQQAKPFIPALFSPYSAFLPSIPVSALGLPVPTSISEDLNAAIAAFEASTKQRATQQASSVTPVLKPEPTPIEEEAAQAAAKAPVSRAKRVSTLGGVEKSCPTNNKKRGTRSKVAKACVFCARSHMTCDNGRPCQRCIKRRIGHMCRDSQKPQEKKEQIESVESSIQSTVDAQAHDNTIDLDAFNELPLASAVEDAILDFSLPIELTDVAKVDSAQPLTPPTSDKSMTPVADNLELLESHLMSSPIDFLNSIASADEAKTASVLNDELTLLSQFIDSSVLFNALEVEPAKPNLIITGTTPIEKYVIDAAAPEDWCLAANSLNTIIVSKYENGLLAPFPYHEAYNAVLARAESSMPAPLYKRLTNAVEAQCVQLSGKSIAEGQEAVVEGLLMEEAVHRLICEYDGIFANSGMPAALWRKTGDIVKVNREFAALVNLPVERLAGGEFNITQFMTDVSGVVYWEKLGGIISDPQRKAVLTTCTLVAPIDGYQLQCCFSFTVRRDSEGNPLAIAGNFCPVGMADEN